MALVLFFAGVMGLAPGYADVYLGLDGGLEGSATVDNSTTFSSGQTNKWTKDNSDTTIAEETTHVRSGDKAVRVRTANASAARRIRTPFHSFASKTTAITIQYYRMVTNTPAAASNQVGVVRSATETLQGTYDRPTSANTWEKKTYSPTSVTLTSLVGVIMSRGPTSVGENIYIDDLCMYDGGVDNSAPNSPGSLTVSGATASTLDLSWGAASGGVDSGGYLAVRYTSNPASGDDPNVNGIYAVNNTVTGSVNGTVAYQGDGTSFTDTGLTSGQTYYYKVYTYDKAYNYSAEVTGNGTTSASCSPGQVALVQQVGYYTKFTSGGDIFNSGGAQMGMWANSGSEQVVAWRNFRTDGSGGGDLRELQPGDRFRITINGPNPNGRVGVSINDGAATATWNDRTNNTRGFIQVQGGGANDYFVTHDGGTPSWSGVRPNSTDQTIVFDILSSHEFTANIEGQTAKYDLSMLNSPSVDDRVDGFSLFLNDDAGDIFWKQTTAVTNLGYVEFGADNGTRDIKGKVTDGTSPACPSTTSPNLLRKTGTGTITLQHNTNTYSAGTRVEAGTLAVFDDGNLGAAPGGSVATNIDIYSSATLRATNSFVVNANRGIFLGHVNGPSITVDGGKTLTYGGVLGGNAEWNKKGDGILSLTGTSSTNSGRISIQAGMLLASGDGSFGVTPGSAAEKINIWSTGTLGLTNVFTLNANRSIELGTIGGPRIWMAPNSTATINSVISGSAAWTNIGPGTLILAANNTFSGALVITSGVVKITATNGLGTAAGNTTVFGGTALEVRGVSSYEPLALNGHGILGTGALYNDLVTAAGTLTNTISLSSASAVGGLGALTFSGVVSGSGQLTKVGTGTNTLSANNTYSGATIISNGLVVITASNGLGTAAGNTTVIGGSALEVRGVSTYEPLALNGHGIGGAGALVNNLNTTAAAATNTIQLNSASAVGGTGSLTLSGVVSGNFRLSKVGSGTNILSGNNTFTGQANISNGVLRISHDNGLGGAASNTTVNSGAALELIGSITTPEALVLNGTGIGSGGALRSISGDNTATNTISLNAASSVGVDAGTLTLSGVISGANTLTKVGSNGRLDLSNNNTYSGTTTISAGNLRISATNGLGTAAGNTTVSSGAALEITGGISSYEPLVLNGTGISSGGALRNISGDNAFTNTISLNAATSIGVDAGTLTLSGTISGANTLTKVAGGTLILTKASTYSGATTVSAGTLIHNGTNTSSAVSISSGAILMGAGSIGGLTVTGTVRPGNDAATINRLQVSSLTMNNGSDARFKIGDCADTTNRDFIQNGGSATINATTTIYIDDSLISNWNNTSTFTWNLIVGGISDASNFTLDDTTYWSSAKGGGTFSLSASGGNLVLTFTPVGGAPVVSTTAITDITLFNAKGGGNVTDDGGSAVVERGVVWNTSGSPTTADSKSAALTGGTGVFTNFISGLSPGQTYYVRAYASNATAISYGLQEEFTAACFSSGPTVLAGSSIGYTNFTANWNAVSGATGYRLDVSTSSNFVAAGGGSIYTNSFEGVTKAGYASNTLTIGGLTWWMHESLIGNSADDRKNGSNSARIRGSGSVGMQQSTNMGLSSIKFVYGKYGTDADSSARVEYTADGWTTWYTANTFTASSTSLTTFEATNLNISGSVAVRIIKTSGGDSVRMNVDDILLFPYTEIPSYVPGFSNLAVAGTSQLVTGLTDEVTYYYRVRAEGTGSCVSPNSSTQSVTTLAFANPAIGVGGAIGVTNMVGSNSSGSFVVTNIGQRLLSYVISTNASWLTVNPITGTNLGEGATASHTVSMNASGLVAGTYNGTITITGTGAGPNVVTNSPRTIDVVFVLTNIPPVIAAGVTNDGNELVRIGWTKESGFDVMIVHNRTNAPSVPVNGTTYNVGSAFGSDGSRVIYKGSGASLEHVIPPGSVNHYAFYSINNNHYAIGLTTNTTMDAYSAGEIVEVFAYTSGVTMVSRNGGIGWHTNFWMGDTNAFTISNGSFAVQSNYPTPRANKLAVTPADGGSNTIRRLMTNSYASGKIYVSYIMNYQYEGPNKYVGLSLLSTNTEKLFVGEVSTADERLGFDGSSSNRVLSKGVGNDYIIIMRYDWGTGLAVANAYKIGTDTVPESEPTVWDMTLSKASNAIGRINGIRLAAGTTGSGTPGTTYFDEIRVATNWMSLLQVKPSKVIYDGFASSSGTLDNGSGGTGWSDNWALGGDPYADYVATSFPQNKSSYFQPTGNKIVMYGDVNGRWMTATRNFIEPYTNGTVYFSWMMNYAFNGVDKYAGIRLLDDTTEKAFVGKVSAGDKSLGIADSTDNKTSAYNIENGAGNDYVIVARYDFSTRELAATAYRTTTNAIAEEPNGYWTVVSTQSVGHVTNLSGVRLSIGAGAGVQIGYVYYDEVRVGTNWYEVTRKDGEAQAVSMALGPTPRLLYIGTNYNPALNPQGGIGDITITDADLANASDPLDIAVLWSNSFGVFMTNNAANLKNESSLFGRVTPNYDPVVLAGSDYQSVGADAHFTNFFGMNGSAVVTTYQHRAFNITNSTFDDTYFITLSAENNNLGGGSFASPNAGNDIPYWRAITVNTALQFFVTDDDPSEPELFEFTINGVGGSGLSNLSAGAIAVIGINGAGAATDRFSFVVLSPFPAGTRFDFVDAGWDANSNNWYNLGEFHTNAFVASGNLDVGQVFELRLDNINADGDQVVIYQYNGTLSPTNDPDNVHFIYAVNLGPGWFTTLAYPGTGTNNQNSMIYRGLTNGVSAVSVPISGSSNARYIGPTTGTASYVLSQISDSSNWQSFSSGTINLTNYNFNITGPGNFDWETPELSDAQVLAGDYRVTNVVRDLESGVLATNTSFGHAPYFKLYNTNLIPVASNFFAVNFTNGTRTIITNRMTAPVGDYDMITLGLVEAIVGVSDFDNDRLNDTLFTTSRVPVLVFDDDIDPPVVGTNAVAAMIGDAALPRTNTAEALVVWNFNNASARDVASYGAGTMANSILTTNSNSGSSINLFGADASGDDFTVQGAANIGRHIQFNINMTGRKDLMVSFAATRSGTGYDSNTIAFAVGTGAFVTVEAGWNPSTSFSLKSVNLSSYTEINGAASVSFRITLGTNVNAATGTANNRFDNMQFNAGYITYYEITDGLLATVDPSNPLRFSFNAYDTYSGLSRGSVFDGTNMFVNIDGVATNNTAAYQAGLSSVGSTADNSTSIWQFTSFSYDRIGSLFADGQSNRPIRATKADADNDRPSDTLWSSDVTYGLFRVIDDDTNTPVVADVNYVNAASRPFIVLTNGGTFAASETVRGLDRRSGTSTNTMWTITDGDLANSGGIGLQFSFGARDVYSGVARGNVGTTNSVMSFSLGDAITGNYSNYNAGLSTTQSATNQLLTNIWSFGSGSFDAAAITAMMAANIGVNPLATTTRILRITIPDIDNDRTNDAATLTSVQVGRIRIADDDARGPLISSVVAEGTTGNEQSFYESFEPALGWTNITSFSGSWTNQVSNGTYRASGNVFWGSLDPKVSGTRRIGLLTNVAQTITWLQLPPVADPGTLTVFAGRFGGEDPTNDVLVSLDRLSGSTWVSLGTQTVSALNPEFEMLSWSVNLDVVTTLRLVRVSTTGSQVYMDDINITPNPDWVSTNQLVLRWTEAVDDYSSVDEYRIVAPAIGTTTPAATNAGVRRATTITNDTFSILGHQGVITGFVFAIDDDNDRTNDRAIGNLKPIVVRIDTNPPPRATSLRASDAAGGNLFDSSIDESSEIKVEWRPGGTNEAHAAGRRESDHATLSPWDSYIISYYEVLDETGSPMAGAITTSITRTTPAWSNVLNSYAFTNLVLSNLIFDSYYMINIQGRDQAGNIGLATSVIGNTDRFIVTQGLARAEMELMMRWTGPTNETTYRDYDVIYTDAAMGFRNSLTSQWTLLQYTNRPVLTDTGAWNRAAPGKLTGTTYRFYRVAREGRWSTNNANRLASEEIYAAKAVRVNPGENWYSLFAFPDAVPDPEYIWDGEGPPPPPPPPYAGDESTVAYVFGTNILHGGSTLLDATKITWFAADSGDVGGLGGIPENIVWLSSGGRWYYSVSNFAQVSGVKTADYMRVPTGRGFLIEAPLEEPSRSLILIGRLPTNAVVHTIPGAAVSGEQEYHILSHSIPERISLINLGITTNNGFRGGMNIGQSDEIRILNNSPTNGVASGSLTSPKARIYWRTTDESWRHSTGAAASGYIIEPDDAVVIVRRHSTTFVWTNRPVMYNPPTKNFTP